MRAVFLSTFLPLTLLPATFAQWGQGWHWSSHAEGYPPQSPTPTTLATIATPATQATIQTEGSPPPLQTTDGGAPTTLAPNTLPATGQPGESTAQPTGEQSAGGPVGTASAPGTSPTTTSPTTPSSNSSDSTGAKGVIYNSANAQQAVSLSPAWACDWDVTPDVSNPPFAFVPQLWGPAHTITTADTAISEYVLFYNEPDNCQGTGGACVGTSQTISDFQSKMAPLKSAGKKVSSPCVTNVGNAFMETFLQGVGKGAVDVLCFHWYGDDVAGLQSTVQTFSQLKQTYDVPEMWISEWGVNSKPSDISQYTQYLDGGVVNRYAYNLFFLGAGGTI